MTDRCESDTAAQRGGCVRRLMLFVAGQEPNSRAARENLRKIFAAEPGCASEVQVVNVFEDHRAALEYGVLVTPCLLVLGVEPRVMIVGTLQETQKVRGALLAAKGEAAHHA